MSKQLSFFEKLLLPQKQQKTIRENGVEKLDFQGHSVQVRRRPYKRTLTLTIKPTGLITVSVGRSTPERKIFQFLHEHTQWIEKSVQGFKDYRAKFPLPDFKEDCELSFCGKKLKLRVRQSLSSRAVTLVEGDQLLVYLPKDKYKAPNQEKHIKEQIKKFYKEEGARRLTEFVRLQAGNMGLQPKKVSFRAQKSRWGSCSSQGNISLNWKLIVAPHFVQNYVVTHELAHLKHMNHSKDFWKLVEFFCADYKKAEEWLKKQHHEAEFLAL